MGHHEPQQFKYDSKKTTQKTPEGTETTREDSLQIDTEDIIAISALIIAVLFIILMALKIFPINELTVGAASLSGIGGVIAKIIKAKKGKGSQSK